MIYEGITVTGKSIDLGKPVSVRINKSDDAPADDLYAAFCYKDSIDELKYIKVYCGDDIAFDGILDEQIVEVSNSGSLLKIYARSIGALLVDNSALPQSYTNVSLEIIFNRHIRPYGITKFVGSNKVFSTEFIVYKGMSEWDVLEKFCTLFLNTTPRISNDGIVNASGIFDGSKNVYLNNFTGEIKYKSISKNIKRFNRISEVFVRAKEESSYSIRVANDDAIKSGVKRKRYLNAYDDNRTPVCYAQSVIDDSDKKASKIVVSCIGAVNTDIGCMVVIEDKLLGHLQNMYISKIKYSMDTFGEITELTMYEGK